MHGSMPPQQQVAYGEDQLFASSPGLLKEPASAAVTAKRRNYLMSVGLAALFIILMFPIMDASRLLGDPAFVYFVGRRWPSKIILSCFGCMFFYFLLLILFFGCTRNRSEDKRAGGAYILVTVAAAFTGLSLVLLAAPLRYEAETAYNELFTNCQFGIRTQRLYEYATVLQGIRSDAACQSLSSIKMCPGYQESMPYTGFLEDMESRYKCAGFCYGSATQRAAAAAVSPAAASAPSSLALANLNPESTKGSSSNGLVDAMRKLEDQRVPSNHQVLGPDQRAISLLEVKAVQPAKPPDAPLTAISSDTDAASAANATAKQPGKQGSYPPTLFSSENYQVSCDGMAARSIRFAGVDAAVRMYFQGAFVLVCVAAFSFLQLTGLCVRPVFGGPTLLKRDKEKIIDM